MERRDFIVAMGSGLFAAPLAAGCTTAPTEPDTAAQPVALPELDALAKQAYIYTFPLYVMYRTRYDALQRFGTPNRFAHARALATPASRAVTAPNNDTLYSSAWLDLSYGPLILHVPETAERYYSLAFMDFYTNNFAYVGRRTTGTQAGDFLIVGPNWQGLTPAGMPLIAAPTRAVWLLGRFMLNGDEDLPDVHALQDQLTLKALSGSAGVTPSSRDWAKLKPDPGLRQEWRSRTARRRQAGRKSDAACGDTVAAWRRSPLRPGELFGQQTSSSSSSRRWPSRDAACSIWRGRVAAPVGTPYTPSEIRGALAADRQPRTWRGACTWPSGSASTSVAPSRTW